MTSTFPTRRILGLMSGTSCDGIDAAAVQLSGSGSTLGAMLEHFVCVPYPPAMRQTLLRAHEMTAGELAPLNFQLGELFAEAALQVLEQSGHAPESFHAVASHGHTVCHLPAQQATLQIAEGAVIAERTGITVVSDFRVADVAAGGQGAPLAPYMDWCLLASPSTHRIVQNIGGIANCTVLPADCALDGVRAWDTGPGNMVIDECVRILTDGEKQFDQDGVLAASGRVDEAWLRELMKQEYFFRPPPATCGREEFGQLFARQCLREGERRGLSTCDIIATITALTAESIAHSYRMHATLLVLSGELEVVLGGGGAFNPTLKRMLQTRLPQAQILTHEDCGIRSDAKEAIAFAILAHETLNGVPSNVPSATGARHSVVLGKISRGRFATTGAQ